MPEAPLTFRTMIRLSRVGALLGAASFAALELASAPVARAQRGKRPMTFDDFAAVRSVGDPQLSPDGRSVLYSVRTMDLKANKRPGGTFVLSLAGGTPRPFPAEGVSVAEARWSPDGSKVAYTEGGQLWVADASGANARQLTKLAGGASGPVWSPAGDRIAFTSSVKPSNCHTVECEPVHPDSQSSGMVYDHLLVRHWTAYDTGDRSHLFVVNSDGGDLRDLVPSAPYDIPPGPFGGSEGYAFSPDGKEIAFTAKDQGRANAWSTDINVYVMPVAGGAPTVITASNRGADENPVYSPDGRYILYHSQATPGFESDEWRLMQYDRASHRSSRLVPTWDRNADTYRFGDASTIYVQTTDASRDKIYRIVRTANGWSARPTLVISGHNNHDLSLSRDGRTAVWSRDAIESPAELYTGSLDAGGVSSTRQLTHENDALLAKLQLNAGEDFWFKSELGDSVQGIVIKPPQYQPGKKYPVLLIIHGGPQSPFLDSWHPRWNFSLFASPGFAIVFINPHGSPGYGQKFTNEVSLDWGGVPYRDLMKGLDAAMVRNASWMDPTHVGAAGASYGGYMINWIAGHTHRFKALFTHDGVWNLEAMAGGTEELWFTEHEFGGEYWNPKAMAAQYRKYSPHLFAWNLKTPQLVVHSELDYRIPISEGISLFTALQRQGVPSRLIIFPDEGHFVLKPANQRLWYHEVLGWFDHYLNH